MQGNRRAVLSVFDIDPFRIGGTEAYARELSFQLAEREWKSILCFNNTLLAPVRQYLALPNVVFEVMRNPSVWGWEQVRGFARILTRHRPAIVHLHHVPLIGAYPWMARLFSVPEVFYTDHWSRPANYVPHVAPFWKKLPGRAVCSPVTGVVCVSDYGLRCMSALQIVPPGKIRRIYNAVSLADFNCSETAAKAAVRFRRRFSISLDRPLVVQVSWMIPEKGIPDLLEAARLVVAEIPNVHFALVGDGRFRDQFTKRAIEMGLAEHVTWTGIVDNPASEGVYAAADVVCQVSHWEEIFGWTITEAMACKRPVVATRVGGIPELVQDGETGFLVPRGDVAAIAARILTLLGNVELRQRMGQAARRITETKFNLKRNVAELIEFYGLGAPSSRQPGVH